MKYYFTHEEIETQKSLTRKGQFNSKTNKNI